MSRHLLEATGLVRRYRRGGLVRRYRRRGMRHHADAVVTAIDHVSLHVDRGETVAVVGESGAGKSTLVRLLLALETPDAGTVHLAGTQISGRRPSQVRPLRRRMQAVFQDPGASLNPALRIGTSVAEPLRAHGIGDRRQRRQRVHELLLQVGLDPAMASRRPEQLSGGECQRVALARALATGPELLLLDEPLSALDVTVRRHLLDLLATLHDRLGLAMVLVSHDLGLVQQLADRMLILLGGAVLEQGPTSQVLAHPAHPYTQQLLAAMPVADPDRPLPAVTTDPQPRSAAATSGACRFADRCPLAEQRCRVEPGLEEIGPGHLVACWLANGEQQKPPATATEQTPQRRP